MSQPIVPKLTSISPKPKFVEVALPIPLQQTFTYSIPSDFRGEISVGTRLIVPFGTRQITGYAVVLHEKLDPKLGIEKTAVKDLVSILDLEPLLTPEIIKLTDWTSQYYASSWGEMLKAALPSGVNTEIEQIVEITPEGKEKAREFEATTTVKISVLIHLNEIQKTTLRELKKRFGSAKTQRAVNSLIKEGWVNKSHKASDPQIKPKRRKFVRLLNNKNPSGEKKLNEAQLRIIEALQTANDEVLLTHLLEKAEVTQSPIKTLAKRDIIEIFSKEIWRDPLLNAELPALKKLVLTDDQNQVLKQIRNGIESEIYNGFLLHGVTGSGKTEVYIRAMKTVLEKGKSSLMLVPEIALTPVFSKRLRAVFGKKVAILHSALSKGERFDEWRRIRNNEAKVVIGTRSAVFAPLSNLGLVVVDEEHDTSYRQHEMPFYNGRDVAIVRAKFADAVVVLGSATPALESFHNSQTGKYEYLSLPNRIGNRPLAKAELIDMREVFEKAGKDPIFSPELLQAIEETHERSEQSIILLNRRGFSRFVLCRSCGETISCRNCEITLTYHRGESKLVCHYCSHSEKAPDECPSCKGRFLYFMGEGTEQIENLLQQKFPKLEIARVDRDTMKRKKELETTLEKFSRGETDMLVGTQMLAKGHDFHNVTLVGVISVDAGLSMPDFRSSERTFQLLTQVAGRAGRGNLRGHVLIQTYYPDHYALKHSKTQSYESFYTEEIEFRKRLNYPPFVALSSILIKHPNYNYALRTANIFRAALDSANHEGNCIILGPAEAPLARLKGEHRLQILVKARNRQHLRVALDSAQAKAEENKYDRKIVYIEIDPINLL